MAERGTEEEASAPAMIGDLIIRALRRHPDRVAFVSEGREITYREAEEEVGRAVAVLDGLGLRPGATVLQFAGDHARQWFVMAACYLTGLRSVTAGRAMAAGRQADVIRDSDAALVLHDGSQADRMARLRAAGPGAVRWACHDDIPGVPFFWGAAHAPAALTSRTSPETIVRLGYTSGTTGPPKGVLLSSRALAAVTLTNLADGEWPPEVRALCPEPISGGFGNLIPSVLLRGGTVVLAGDGDVIAAVERHRPTVLWLMPPRLVSLLDDPRTATTDWSCLRLLTYSGASLPDRTLARARSAFGPVLSQLYGQTECPKSLAVLSRGDHESGDPSVSRSLGVPCSGMTGRLVDRHGEPVATGTIGELCVRGPAVMSGYWRDAALTARTLRGGWLHTGDLCRLDAGGHLHFVGRTADVIVRGRSEVQPADVEAALAAFPQIEDVAVVGLRDDELGQAVTAIAVAPRSTLPELAALAGRAALPEGVVVDRVALVPELPRTAIGRVDRSGLRARPPATLAVGES